MSASLLVDLNNTCVMLPSIVGTPVLSGALVSPCSGAVIGSVVDLLNANTFCNLFAAGFSASGQLRIQVQTSPTTASGDFTDPTSGFVDFPGRFQSGTILTLNSGGAGGGLINTFVSGEALASGFVVAQGFLRPHRYARANLLSGDFGAGPLTIGFISNEKTIGSGGGFTYSPTSGTVNV